MFHQFLNMRFLFPMMLCTTIAVQAQKNNKMDNPIEQMMRTNPLLANIHAQKDSLRVQIVYTQIDRDANNVPSFKSHHYNLNRSTYFYPASTAKMPIAFLALQKLNELKIEGLNKNSAMLTDSAWPGQFPVYHDPTSADGRASVAHYIKQVFMVSDNEANNRLYEFCGQEYINNELYKKGYKEAQILHRLGVGLNDEQNRHTNPIRFLDENGKLIYGQAGKTSAYSYLKRNNLVGKGYYKGGQLMKEPFNFSQKNRLHLDELTQMLLTVLFPEKFDAKQKFNLTEDDYRFLYQQMSQLPTESNFPDYSADSSMCYDAYCKFLLYGSEKGNIPKTIRIFNKVGDAYGFLTDIAYVVDFEKNIEFALSATILCNSDGIFNDDQYEYETVGWPFLKNLGRAVYEHELKRNRKFVPNLEKFKITYDKTPIVPVAEN
jgi:hypothetical protein